MKNNNKKFWGRYSKFYDKEVLRFSGKAYETVYKNMSKVLTEDMRVLELATGTGLIALNIASYVDEVIATDYSEGMITSANKKEVPNNVSFSVEDATDLSFDEDSFDAVIISNALHIMPDPAKALSEIKRVLKPRGLLIAPNFSHGHIGKTSWDINKFILKIIGFETYSKWTPNQYVSFLEKNGFSVKNWFVLEAAFPLVYVEAINND